MRNNIEVQDHFCDGGDVWAYFTMDGKSYELCFDIIDAIYDELGGLSKEELKDYQIDSDRDDGPQPFQNREDRDIKPFTADESNASISRDAANNPIEVEPVVMAELSNMGIDCEGISITHAVRELIGIQTNLNESVPVDAESMAVSIYGAIFYGLDNLISVKRKQLDVVQHDNKLKAIAKNLAADYIDHTADCEAATEWADHALDRLDYTKEDHERILEIYRDSF